MPISPSLKSARDAAVQTGKTDAKKGYNALNSVKEIPVPREVRDKLLDSTPAPTPVTVDGKDIVVDDRIIPGLSEMSPEARATALTEMTQKMEGGKQTLDAILSGEPRDYAANPPTKEEISNMMWYIRAMAENKMEESFFKMLTISDPGNNFHKFIEACPSMHLRGSSHVSAARDQANSEHGKKAMGAVLTSTTMTLPCLMASKQPCFIRLNLKPPMAQKKIEFTSRWKPMASPTSLATGKSLR